MREDHMTIPTSPCNLRTVTTPSYVKDTTSVGLLQGIRPLQQKTNQGTRRCCSYYFTFMLKQDLNTPQIVSYTHGCVFEETERETDRQTDKERERERERERKRGERE